MVRHRRTNKRFFTNKKYDEDDPTFEEFLNPEFSNYSYDMDSFMILGRSFSDYSILINKLVATYQDAEYKKLINDGSFPWSKFIRSELNQFEKSFGNYLRLKIEESKTYENESKNLIQKLSNNKPYNLLSFNYTNPVKNSKNLVNFRNIHGDLDNPILGIDSTSIKPTDEAFTYTKTYRIMDNSENKSDPILTHNIKEIVIFGHSLNDSDFSYFDSIFDYYNIYDSDIRLVFAYKIYSDDEENIASDHYLAVSNLLYKYGETFDNKSHGRNLMHKMLIEKRLELREIKD
ncbi:AbiH family protein [Lentilactobacillus kosonis]|uniref:SIR2-like domain-containing protein n=1 Tax=Lentilactobacillus kosonis TaxID=2810561 RepID=A0A401FPQ2_9LACO|nr:AbiH family protein [Lentilactobacillus kosonis]GAY74369.1 hypothetical protein NBRC111893_2515 [Lentilactobacillus kosonis]